jgi:very-short-patch-repair endonuclease
MAINLKKSRQYLQDFDFASLFIEELGWSNPPSDSAIAFKCDGKTFYRKGVAELAGVLVLEITTEDGEIPDAKVRANVHKEICKLALENLVIFLDKKRSQSLWYWVKREGTKQYRRDHLYVKGQSGDLFLSKLGALVVDLKDWETGNVSVVSAARRLKDSFDIDRVTKKFFSEFQTLHGDFLELIQGIEFEGDRRWYASILLNRLMFVYFLQRKYFLDNGDELYLQNKLKASKQEGTDCFYREFLQPLFFQGFGKPEGDRGDALKKKIGKIRYLNGGLFLEHSLETKYKDAPIQVADRAFEQVLDLFSRYSWNLDDTPEGKDDEINPDVLGYIFEKYINQKEFGAYYTRPEITEYLCDRTINKLILDKVSSPHPSANRQDSPHPLAPSPKTGEGGQENPKSKSSLTPLSPLGRGAGGEGLDTKNTYWQISPVLHRQMVKISQELRKKSTASENILWQALRNRKLEGRKFRRQQPIGAFVVDFFCGVERLVVEIDGGIHETQKQLDLERQQLIESLGIRFIRISSDLVETNLPLSLEMISNTFEKDPHPLAPSPKTGEGGQDSDLGSSSLAPLSPLGRGAGGEGLTDLLLNLNADLCDRLLNQILPNLTLLDPACGSGAFLVAAMKTLIGVYATVVSQARRFVEDPHPLAPSPKEGEGGQEKSNSSSLAPLSRLGRGVGGEGLTSSIANIQKWLDDTNSHPSLDYYIKKRIITDNLYGVDIMQEATEIAKLRLFLALVASAKKVDELEPLPNIDFNIMAGNSLIGLIRVDTDAFAQGSQGTLENQWTNDRYNQILDEKNRDIALYKKHSFQSDSQRHPDHRSQESSVAELRNQIEKLNTESQVKLNDLLLNEFSGKLKIKFEEAQLTGKPKKRVLNVDDINVLEPFHWGYHFDKVFERGGFDAIIANPPWEIFKPQAKEFFAHHSELVTKNKMDIKTFEKEQKKLLESPEVATAWLEYQSKFPYVSSYFRSAEDYRNQISVVNGKKAGTDINLYKLFLERCYHLLRKGGECGIVIPSGIYTDLGTKQLREMLFSETEITGLFCFENRKAIFEGVDSRFKFIILTFEKGSKTESFPTRFMRHDVTELTNFPTPDDIRLDIPLIRKLSPDSLSIMEFKGEIDIQIAKKMMQFPFLYDSELGWDLELYGEELHMNRGAKFFQSQKTEYPLYEGGMILHFSHCHDEPRYWINESDLRSEFLEKRRKRTELNDIPKNLKNDYEAYRIAIRKIARNTDSRTLISCLIPKNCLAGNSLSVHFPFENNSHNYNGLKFTSKELLVLVSLLSSFPADYILRSRMTANLNTFYLYQLPVPRLQKGDKWFDAIVTRAAKLICTTPEFDELAKEVGLAKKDPHPLAPSPKKGEGGQESSLTPLSPLGRGAGGEGNTYGVINEIERGKLRAELDGIIAHIYGLTEAEFQYILTTFPIVADPVKLNALNAYRDVSTGLIK